MESRSPIGMVAGSADRHEYALVYPGGGSEEWAADIRDGRILSMSDWASIEDLPIVSLTGDEELSKADLRERLGIDDAVIVE